jgi:hypothetical protein
MGNLFGLRTVLVLIVAVIAGSVVVGGGAQAATGKTGGWTIIHSVSPPRIDYLQGVSCTGSLNCMAVGGNGEPGLGGNSKALAESWNGSKWSVVPGPSYSQLALTAVSCGGPSNCMAVGSVASDGASPGVIESWNGSSWSFPPFSNGSSGHLSNELAGVSCSGPSFCVAVGAGDESTELIMWNGSTWSFLPSSVLGRLNGVSCSGPTSCMAVGSGFTAQDQLAGPLVEIWNGSTWSVISNADSLPNDTLTGVSCISSSACIAVGSQVESWNGSVWSLVPTPALSTIDLRGVSCTSRSACIAVGQGSTGTEVASWNGSTWSVIPSKNRGRGSILAGVSCTGPIFCAGVGWHGHLDGIGPGTRTLVESPTGAMLPGQLTITTTSPTP